MVLKEFGKGSRPVTGRAALLSYGEDSVKKGEFEIICHSFVAQFTLATDRSESQIPRTIRHTPQGDATYGSNADGILIVDQE